MAKDTEQDLLRVAQAVARAQREADRLVSDLLRTDLSWWQLGQVVIHFRRRHRQHLRAVHQAEAIDQALRQAKRRRRRRST